MKFDWPVSVRFAGLGGQGLVTAGAVLAQACAQSGFNVASSQSYGSQARGGITKADVVISKDEIDFPHVLKPDLLIAFAQEAYDKFVEGITKDGFVLVDSYFVKIGPRSSINQKAIDATKTAIEKIESKLAANFVMLGALVGLTRIVDQAAIEQVMPKIVSNKFLQVNLDAFQAGHGLGEGLGV